MDIQRTQSGDQMLISATVKSTGNLTQEQVIELAQALENELGRKLTLDIITLPVISSGP
jgi:F0F1-type ATP synthase delta subunit